MINKKDNGAIITDFKIPVLRRNYTENDTEFIY